MHKKLTKLLAGLLTCSILTMPVSAEDMTVSYDSSADGSNPTQTTDCTVEVEKAEIYCVKLPKSVQLDGSKESPTFEYTVEVSGEISADNYVRVIPLDGGYIETEAGDRVDITVTQDVIKWTSDQVLTGSNTTGEMKAIDLNPGKYFGKVQFFISLDDGYFYQAATCTTPKLRIAEDKNDNGVQDADEALDTPVAIGRPLGHTYEGKHEFEYNCTRCLQTVYEVSTPEELYDFAEAVNGGKSFANQTVSLIADLDMYDSTSATALSPIGTYANAFQGTFDGGNHKISKITQINSVDLSAQGSDETSVQSTVGLFGFCTNGATIKNLIVEDWNAKTSGSAVSRVTAAALVGGSKNGTTIENCRITNCSITFDATTDTRFGCYYYGAPFVGTITSNCAEADRITVINSCATGFLTTFNCVNGGASAGATASKIIGYGAYQPSVTLERVYSVSGITANTPGRQLSTGTAICSYKFAKSSGSSQYILKKYLPFTDYAVDSCTDATGCVDLTDDELKSQTGVDLLNTGYTEPVWKLDLLNENNGYPIQIV